MVIVHSFSSIFLLLCALTVAKVLMCKKINSCHALLARRAKVDSLVQGEGRRGTVERMTAEE